MSLKFFVFCATLAIARAGYLQPAVRYAHAAPIAVAAPAPLTYAIPPSVRAEHLPPVVTTSYGYSSGHTPVPAPVIRAEPIHHAPVAFAAPAIQHAPIARVALPAPLALAAPAPVAFAAPAPAPVAFAAPAPAPLAFAAPAIHSAPAPLAFAGPAIHAAPAPLPSLGFAGSHLGFGRGYAAGFGFGPAPAIHAGLSLGAGFGRGFAAPAFSGPLGAAPLSLGHSTYGNHF
ncbi:hypothetical protein FQR65_LT00513 [Abscondita terminalis]|nr:hypothetical protein FQR65_LT00513 [Abscondita terminalis]